MYKKYMCLWFLFGLFGLVWCVLVLYIYVVIIEVGFYLEGIDFQFVFKIIEIV